MGKNPKITINDTNESILHILKSKEIVSSFKEEMTIIECILNIEK